MFCPICESEYVAYEEVLATLNPAEIALIKSLLDEAGIDYRFLTEVAGPPLAMPARLLVPKDRVREAKELLDDFIAGGQAVADGEDEGEDE